MRRDVDRLTASTFDLLVVGGGVYGLTIAYDAAQRGLSVALIERRDFGGGASFNHLRTIHGGLRYLQTLDVARARESLFERRTLARIAPHAVQPLRFVLPLDRSLTRGSLAMTAGFLLDRAVAFDRNEGLPANLSLPAGRVLSRDEAVAAFPELRLVDCTGAAVWYDYITPESDRLTFSYGLAADAHGAVLANYIDATAPIIEQGRVAGMQAVDRQSGRTLDIASRLTVNATGAAVAKTAHQFGEPVRKPLLKAMNLVTRLEPPPYALGGRARSGRNLFLVPWKNRSVIGTWESATTCDADAADASRQDVGDFLREINSAFPQLGLTFDDVVLVHRGAVPAVMRPDGRVALEGHERVHDHAADGVDGLISVAGTKYTTARAVAERVVSLVFDKLGRPAVPCQTAARPLVPHVVDGSATTVPTPSGKLPPDVAAHLVAAYGPRWGDVAKLLTTGVRLGERISDASPVLCAELVWAVREEMAVTLTDAVVRRTPLGAVGDPGPDALDRAGAIVGDELGWSSDQRRVEIDAVRRLYP